MAILLLYILIVHQVQNYIVTPDYNNNIAFYSTTTRTTTHDSKAFYAKQVKPASFIAHDLPSGKDDERTLH